MGIESTADGHLPVIRRQRAATGASHAAIVNAGSATAAPHSKVRMDPSGCRASSPRCETDNHSVACDDADRSSDTRPYLGPPQWPEAAHHDVHSTVHNCREIHHRRTTRRARCCNNRAADRSRKLHVSWWKGAETRTLFPNDNCKPTVPPPSLESQFVLEHSHRTWVRRYYFLLHSHKATRLVQAPRGLHQLQQRDEPQRLDAHVPRVADD
jgi:hypothetical protein